MMIHSGARIALQRLTMNELDIARAMAAGELTSPQRYMNVWLFDIRISGTGHAYRGGIKEYVWRKPEIYLTDEFLARCNGLTVIWVHPQKGMLNSDEFAKRVIGSIFLPYIKNEDVWGIAKIYDDSAAADMATQDLSTSPGVILGNGEDIKIKLPDGSPLLIEDDPRLVDHIAVVPAGVWDKGGDPSGIRTDSVRKPTMAEKTEEEKEADRKDAEDKARRDAESNIASKVMDALDSMNKRLDAMEMDSKARRDKEEEDRKDAAKRERDDWQAKRDAEREGWMKEDAAQCAMDDADEEKEAKELETAGEEKDAALDRARKDRRLRMDKRRKDAAKAEEDRRDAARRDAANIEKQVADAVRAHLKDDTAEERDAKADAQARADSVYHAFNDSAPPPMRGETAAAYDIRLIKGMQKHSVDWKDVDLHALPDAARTIARTRIYADAVVASQSVADLPEGRLIPHTETTQSGHRVTTFRGKNTFIMGLKRPSMRVTKFLTERRT